MGFASGDIITAQKLGWLSPKWYGAVASGTVAPSSTGVDVPGCTVTFNTDTAGAQIKVIWKAAFYAGAAQTGVSFVRASIDGTLSSVFAISATSGALDKQDGSATWDTTLVASGSHTVKLVATTLANITLQTHTSMSIEVLETF